MYIVPWDKEIETGIELIDQQHKEFLMNVNKFIIKVRVEKKTEAAQEEIAFLQNYLLYHFQTEEAFMYENAYPQYLDHQAAHKNLTFQVKEMATKLKVFDFSDEAVQNFYEMLNHWVIGHIQVMDKAFAKYYLESQQK